MLKKKKNDNEPIIDLRKIDRNKIISQNQKKEKNIKRSIIEWVIYIAALALIVWGTPLILTKVLKTQYPIASITSSSMWPALKKGDLVFIKGASGKSDINLGDIVVYKNSGASSGQAGFTIHRVVKLNDETFVTRGDANNVDDKPVKYEELIGKTVNFGSKPLRVPYLGMLSQVFKK